MSLIFSNKYTLIPCNDYDTSCYRIRALKDIPAFGVKAGDFGGRVSRHVNLSQYGSCWIGYDACVFNYALVGGDAYVYDNAFVLDNAIITNNARVFGKARIDCFAKIIDNAQVFDDALVTDLALVMGSAKIGGQAKIESMCIFKEEAF